MATIHHSPLMTEPLRKTKPSSFVGRLIAAFRNSFAGYRHAFASESALREELVAFVILAPLSLALPVSRVEHLMLLLSLILVILVELLNTAIEATVDRISLELHPLAGMAKDLGSASVLTALVMTGICWVMIAGPVVLHWWRG
ncbi:MAG: diacylglycerol kinase [Gemmatimonadaceae bacterium]|nr:diacylglycerol kinase [Gemmatimonadaceae bacterium]